MPNYTITFTVPADRLQLFVDLIVSEGLEISVSKQGDHQALAKPEITRHHVPGKSVSEVLWDALQHNNGATANALASHLAAKGFNRNSLSPGLARLCKAELATKKDGKYYRLGTSYDKAKVREQKG